MKRIILLGLCSCFLLPRICSEKVEGSLEYRDKWVFDRGGPMEVVGCDAQFFSVKFQGNVRRMHWSCRLRQVKSQCQYMMEKDRRTAYSGFRKTILNFPYHREAMERLYKGFIWRVVRLKRNSRNFRFRGEEVEVRAGKFKASSWNINRNFDRAA